MAGAFDDSVWLALSRINQDQPQACAEVCHGIQLIGHDVSLIIDALLFHGILIDDGDGHFGPIQKGLGKWRSGIQVCRDLALPLTPFLVCSRKGRRSAHSAGVNHIRWPAGLFHFLQQLRELAGLLLQKFRHHAFHDVGHFFGRHRPQGSGTLSVSLRLERLRYHAEMV